MERIPEPEELMDDAEQALAYAQADFSEANGLFVDLLQRQSPGPLSGRLLDLGCGPADIPLEISRQHPALQIDAVDGARSMLDLAQRKIDANEELKDRIELYCEHLPCANLPEKAYRLIISNSLLHHLTNPQVMWQTVAACAQPGAHILVMDLTRPASELAVDSLVETYAIDAPDVLRKDFRNSLFASYSVAEVEAQLQTAGLHSLKVSLVSDRHLAVSGRI